MKYFIRILLMHIGAVAHGNSFFGKPNRIIHLNRVTCNGNENKISDCTASSFSLEEGRMLDDKVAGVQCYSKNICVPPPPGGVAQCTSGDIRLVNINAVAFGGYLQYCYNGTWSSFCSMEAKEAIVACRQLELGFGGV